jgi:hypothetical protein
MLSKNFPLWELIRSDIAMRHGIDNIPGEQELANLRKLAWGILQPVRDHFGPTNVSSGFRCLEVNRAAKSGDTSQHVKGEAADSEVLGVPNREVALWIEDELDFDQLILEFYTPGQPNSGWIHCSYVSEEENKGEVWTATREGKEIIYTSGIIS